jgi:hypothetical protein
MTARQILPAVGLLVTFVWSTVMVLLGQAAVAAAVVPAVLQLAGTWLVVRDGDRRSWRRGPEDGGPESQKEQTS